jgi:hypothetical protein
MGNVTGGEELEKLAEELEKYDFAPDQGKEGRL